jgi:hypothetical protein
VVASWILWPPVFYTAYWLANTFLVTGRRCSIEGCNGPDGWLGLLWLAGLFAPPLYVTWRWYRDRRRGRGVAG